MTTVLTVGHGTATQDELGTLLRNNAVRMLVDVRIAPGSRRHPHVGRDALVEWLKSYDVDYRWERRLGGFRKLRESSPDIALRNDSFRAYAGHMRSAEFADAIDGVVADAGGRRTAVMCSESVWWRCHRRLIADFLSLVRDVEVLHLMPGGRLEPHRPTEGVRVGDDGLLVYDAGAQPLPSSSD